MKKTLAGICNSCPMCSYARKNPDTLIGKVMHWHGKWCPMWKAWNEVYGEGAVNQVTIKETEPMTVAFINMTGPYAQISESSSKLYDWVEQEGYQVSGPLLGIYYNAPGEVPDDKLVWELLSPIADDADPSEPDRYGLGVKRLKTIQVASTRHKGPYEEMGKTYERLGFWIRQNGYKIAGPSQEVYLSNPEETAPEELLTEVMLPIEGQ